MSGPDPQTTTTTSTLPDWAKGYVTNLLSNASTIASQPYQPYGGQRFAGFNPLESQGYKGIGGLAPSSYLGSAANMASAAGTGAAGIGQNYANMATDPASMQKYMSPYMQNVVEQQKLGAVRDYARQMPGLQAQGIRAGARGGTREALLQSENQRNLQQQLQGLQATGSQQAFQNAQQAQQFGAGLGLQGLQSSLGAAQVLGGLGGQQFDQQLRAAQAQQQGGMQMRGLEQQRLDAMYQDWLAQRQYPQQQASFMADILRGGTPSTQTTASTTYTPAPSSAAQAAGILALLYGLGK